MRKIILFVSFLIIVCVIFLDIICFKFTAIKCSNGMFIGKKELYTDVIAFKGIPYAKAPTGKLRWKAPVGAPDGKRIKTAFKYNSVALQTNSEPELKKYKKTEDCLKLNIWTSDLKKKNKPVMVYFHGGSYGWEGAALPTYDGQFLVNEYKDIILVSVDYRLNLMGFINFKDVEGGQNFKDSGYLGILDCIEALKWVKKNIASFGGNPNNVTIFGESAGGGIVSILLVVKDAQGLFKRAIAQSGTLNLTAPIEVYQKLGQEKELMKLTGAKNMTDLMALPSKQILKAMSKDTGKVGTENGSNLASLNNFPLRGSGSIIPDNPFKSIEEGMSKNVDLMIGTTADELRYWVHIMAQGNDEKNFEVFSKFIKEKAALKDKKIQQKYFETIKVDNDKYNKQYKDVWKNTELANDTYFRMPSLKVAESHIKANGKGKTYVYYFAKKMDVNDWIGAAHASELPYVFYNINLAPNFYGKIDKDLAKRISNAWVNFARTGDPSSDATPWLKYDLKYRKTMVIGNDKTMKMRNDYKGAQRKILAPLYK